MKRLLLFLLAFLGLGYAVLVLFALYLAHTIGHADWAETEPWFGPEPEVVESRSREEWGSAWLVKADDAWVASLVQRVHAEPAEPLADEEPHVLAYRRGHRISESYRTPKPLRLVGASGSTYFGRYQLNIDVLSDGYADLRWLPYDRYGCDATKTEPLELCAASDPRPWRKQMLTATSLIVCNVGPTLLIDAALLLLLPSGARRRRLWYLLPLAYVPVVMLFIGLFISAQDEATPFVILLAIFAFSWFWCGLSLLQSLLFGGMVRLCRFVSEKRQKHHATC